MRPSNAPILLTLLIALSGCSAPSARLTFPEHPASQNSRGVFYNVNHHSAPDFALLTDDSGRIESVAYDDAGDGHFNRVYRLRDYRNQDVPHLIVLLDSIPYWAMAERWDRGGFRCFDRPQKVIPVFPSLTGLCFSRLLGAPPLPGIVDDYYDRDSMSSRNAFWTRVLGRYREPWERRVHYAASGYESGLAYLHPREWFDAELARAKKRSTTAPTALRWSTSSAPRRCSAASGGPGSMRCSTGQTGSALKSSTSPRGR